MTFKELKQGQKCRVKYTHILGRVRTKIAPLKTGENCFLELFENGKGLAFRKESGNREVIMVEDEV